MKKSNISKIIIAIIVIILVVIGITLGNKLVSQKKVIGNKTITITIEDQVNHKTLMDNEVFHTNSTTLAEFLTENKNELKVDMLKEKPYGDFLVGLYGLKTTDMRKGPWWIYSYSAPAEKLNYKVGTAPSIDKINLAKQNSITFVFTSNMG